MQAALSAFISPKAKRYLLLSPFNSSKESLNFKRPTLNQFLSSFGGVGGGCPLLSRLLFSPCQKIEKRHLSSSFITRMWWPSFRDTEHLPTGWCSTIYPPFEIFAYFRPKEKLRTYIRFSCGQFWMFIQRDCIIIHFYKGKVLKKAFAGTP